MMGRIILLIVVALSLGRNAHARSSHLDEYKVKALFLGSLLKYTKFADTEGAYTIAVIGKNPFGGHLKKLEERKINKRSIKVFFFRQIPEGKLNHHLIYFPKTEKIRQKEVLENMGKNSLAVGDNKWFIESGGDFNIILKRKGIRWETNYKSLDQKTLQVSSKLLRLSLNKRLK